MSFSGQILIGLVLFVALASLRPEAAFADNGPVQVFVFAGQSNMVGYGRTENEPSNANGEAGTLRGMVNANPGAFGFGGTNPLVDSGGDWLVRGDVSVYAYDNNNGNPVVEKGGHTPGFGIIGWNGPEYGFGQVVGNALERDVLILKVAKGGTTLGVNWRSPSAVTNRGGAVGDMWTTLITEVDGVLTNLGTHFPEYDGREYEVAGFGWHQGWNDGGSVALYSEYEANLVDLIADVRATYGSGLPVVVANTGMLNAGTLVLARPNVYDAQNRVGDPALHPELVGNVAVVDTTPFWRPPDQSPKDEVFHWNQNGVTMYEIGAGMGDAYLTLTAASVVTGDYDGSGQVEQGDLDTVLQNWGTGAFAGAAAALPGGGPFDGTVDQNELDGVLQNWGNTSAPGFGAAAVPEPALAALLGMLDVGRRRRR